MADASCADRPNNETSNTGISTGLGLIATRPDWFYDSISRASAALLSTELCVIAFIKETDRWYGACAGADDATATYDPAFFHALVGSAEPTFVEDTRRDARWTGDPFRINGRGVRFFAAIPLVGAEGTVVGALCAMDASAIVATAAQRAALGDLAALVSEEHARRRLPTNTAPAATPVEIAQPLGARTKPAAAPPADPDRPLPFALTASARSGEAIASVDVGGHHGPRASDLKTFRDAEIEILSALAGQASTRSTLRLICKNASALLGGNAVYCLERNRRTGEFFVRVGACARDTFGPSGEVTLGRSAEAIVKRAQSCASLETDGRADAAHPPAATGRDCRCQPVLLDDGEAAALLFADAAPTEPAAPIPPETILQLFAGLAGAALRRERADHETKVAQQRLQDFASTAADGFFELDREGRLTFLSSEAVQLLGLADGRTIGRTLWDIAPTGCAWGVQARLGPFITQRRAFRDIRIAWHRDDLGPIDLAVTAQPMISPEDDVIGLRGTLRDITRLNRAFERNQKSERVYRLLQEQAITSDKTIHERMKAILKLICREFGFSGGVVARFVGDRYEVVTSYGTRCGAFATSGPLAQSIVGTVFGAPENMPTGMITAATCDGVRHIGAGGEIDGLYLIPLRKNAAVWGCVALTRMAGAKGEIDDLATNVIRLASRWISDTLDLEWAIREVNQNRERFQDFAAIASDWWWETDDQLRFTFVSDSIRDLTGADPAEFIGRTRPEVYRAIYDLGSEKVDEIQRLSVLREPIRDIEIELPIPSGSVWLRLDGRPYYGPSGRFLGYRGVGCDITSRKRLDETILTNQRREIGGQIAGGIAHDINNLVSVIAGNLNLLRTEAIDVENEYCVDLIDDCLLAVTRAVDVTRGLLSLTKSPKFRLTRVDVIDAIRKFSPLIERSLPEGISLTLNLPDRSVFARTNESYLQTALLNLAINARDAMGGRGALLIAVQPSFRPGTVAIATSDTGPGIPAGLQEQVFEPLFTTKGPSGTGLGLAMVKRFVDACGGEVTLSASPSGGACFVMQLPMDAAAVQPERDAPTQIGDEPRRILVVDDERGIRRLLQCELTHGTPWTVEVAENATAALDLLAHATPVDAIVTDVEMPGPLDGIALVTRVRETIQRDIPITIVTGSPSATVRARQSFGDTVEIVAKPIDATILRDSLRTAFRRGRY